MPNRVAVLTPQSSQSSVRKHHLLPFGEPSTQTVGTKIASAVRPITVAPITAIGGQVKYGIQVFASAFETTTVEAVAAAAPRVMPTTSRIIVSQMVIDSSCRVVATTRRSNNRAPRRSMVAMATR